MPPSVRWTTELRPVTKHDPEAFLHVRPLTVRAQALLRTSTPKVGAGWHAVRPSYQGSTAATATENSSLWLDGGRVVWHLPTVAQVRTHSRDHTHN